MLQTNYSGVGVQHLLLRAFVYLPIFLFHQYHEHSINTATRPYVSLHKSCCCQYSPMQSSITHFMSSQVDTFDIVDSQPSQFQSTPHRSQHSVTHYTPTNSTSQTFQQSSQPLTQQPTQRSFTSYEIDLYIINQVHAQPALWDKSNCRHKDIVFRNNCFSQIASSLPPNPENGAPYTFKDVRDKWNDFRDRYQKMVRFLLFTVWFKLFSILDD